MAELAALGWGVWAISAAGVLVGTLLQRLAGQGFGMIAAPAVAIAAPGMLPAALLLLGAFVGFSATAIDRSAIAPRELPAGFAGRALGAVIAAWIAANLPDPDALAVVVAGVVYLGIALSLVGVRVAIRAATLFSAGIAAGLMGTLTAVGAPPMALLYQHEEQSRSAAMQNTFFAWGMMVSILALVVAGLVSWRHLAFALSLLPAAALALVLAQMLAPKVARSAIRPWALGLAGAAATLLMLRVLL